MVKDKYTLIDNDLVDLIGVSVLAWCLLETNYLDHERLIQLLELRHHDHLVKVDILGEELEAIVLENDGF